MAVWTLMCRGILVAVSGGVSAVTSAAILRATWTETGVAVPGVVWIAVCVATARLAATSIRTMTFEVTVAVNPAATSTGTPRAVGEAILRVQPAPEACRMLSDHLRPHRAFAAALPCDTVAAAPHRGSPEPTLGQPQSPQRTQRA